MIWGRGDRPWYATATLVWLFALSSYGANNSQAAVTSLSVLRITTASMPNGVTGTVYDVALAASGGTPPYTWSLAKGASLPAGLSLSAAGAITGTPASAGTTTFAVTVTDASSPAQTQSKQESITIGAASTVAISIAIPSGDAVSVPLGAAQSLAASVTGTSNTAVSWSVAGEPDGNSTVGTIAGGTATAVTYDAPAAMPPGNPVTVSATSLADSSKTASLVVNLTPAAGKANPVVAVGAQQTQGINLSLASLSPTLGLADVGTCTGTLTPTLSVSCGSSVTGISAAQGASVIVWALGQGLTNSDGSNLAAGLQVNVSQGTTSDVTVANVTPGHPQSGLSTIYFQMRISSSATPGLRNLIVTNAAGELQHFVGAIEITAGP